MTVNQPIASLAELRALIDDLPGADDSALAAAAAREAVLTKPPGALGRLEELAAWAASWQGHHPPSVERPRVCVFAGNHGVVRHGVSAFPAEVTAQMVKNFRAGGAAINQLCRVADAELRVFELALAEPAADITNGPALSERECLNAIAYGMAAAEPGLDLLALGEMGIGNTTAAAAMCLSLFGGAASDWTGPGTGVAGPDLAHKTEIVARAVTANQRRTADDPLQVLRCLGGHELAAIVGAIVGARLLHIPVLLDGYVCSAAAAVLHAVRPGALDHCRVAHLSAEPAHIRLLARLGQQPLLDMGMCLGEGSGAALAINILRAAIECHNGMASFVEAGVAGADDPAV